MGFRLYRSVKLGKGVRLNLSKTGIGVSAGIPGARYSVHSSGRTTRTVGVPGSGVSYRQDTYSKGGRSRLPPVSPTPAPLAYPKAGLLAPKAEKEFVRGVTAYMHGRFTEALAALQSVEAKDAVTTYMQEHYADALAALQSVDAKDPGAAHIGEEFFAALSLVALDRVPEAIPYFEVVLASNGSIPDPVMSKYGIGGAMEVSVTPAVSITLPMSNLAVALMLAEAYQNTGQQRKAIELLESLGAEAPGAPVFALSLADLYSEAERWDDVIRVTEAVEANENDITLDVLVFRALAMMELDLTDGALALTKECLRFGKRNPALLRFARYVRGRSYEREGKAGMARREFVKIYAEDAGFADVAQRLGREPMREPSPPPRPDV
ncbi:MAG: DUF4236 domain-containing protein [Actinomycetota bacterium]